MAYLSQQMANLPDLGPSQTYNPNVETLQNALMSAGYLSYADFSKGAGYYGPATTAAVARWQSENNIPTNGNPGYFGPASKSAITTYYAPKPASTATPTTPVVNNPTTPVNNPVVNNSTVNAQNNNSGYNGYAVPAYTPAVTADEKIYYKLADGTTFWGGVGSAVSPIGNPVQITKEQYDAIQAMPGQRLPAGAALPGTTNNVASASGTPGVKDPNWHFVIGGGGSAEIWSDATFKAYPGRSTEISYDQWAAYPQKSPYVPSGAESFVSNKGLTSVTPTQQNTQSTPFIDPTKPAGTFTENRGTPLDANNVPIAVGDTTTKIASYRRSDGSIIPAGYYNVNAASTLTDAGNIANAKIQEYTSTHPMLTPGTQEYEAALANVKNQMWDVMEAQVNAKTEQEQQAAQYIWNELVKKTKKELNINLSGNASQAYSEIQKLANTYNQQNIQGSGLQNESVDQYLRKVRLTDSQNRETERSSEDKANMEYLKRYGTTQQIADFVAKNPQKAQAWGLIPSDIVKNTLNRAALMSKFPGMTEEQADAAIATVIDTNGNYYSSINQKKMTGENTNIDLSTQKTNEDPITGLVETTTTAGDTGLLDIKEARTADKKAQVEAARQTAYNKWLIANGYQAKTTGADSYGPAGNVISGSTGNQGTQLTNPVTTPDPALKAASNAAASLGTNPTNVTPPAGDTKSPITAPVSATPTTTKTPTKYGTLYDAYTANGGSWSAWNSPQRLADAKAAGVNTSTYTGNSVADNQKILDYINKQGSVTRI